MEKIDVDNLEMGELLHILLERPEQDFTDLTDQRETAKYVKQLFRDGFYEAN